MHSLVHKTQQKLHLHPSHHNDTPFFTLTASSTPDPFILEFEDIFYMTFTSGTHIEIWTSPTLTNFEGNAVKTVIWKPRGHECEGCESDIWAPELHAVEGRWYIYFAGAKKSEGNKSHRTFVLGGPPTHEAPVNSAPHIANTEWTFLGPVVGLPDEQWAIDATVFLLGKRIYMVYSGWPLDDTTHSEKRQNLYIVEMDTPVSVTTSPPVLISRPEYDWERFGDAGINEGPQFVRVGGKGHGHGHEKGAAVCGSAMLPTPTHSLGHGNDVVPSNGNAWTGIIFSASGSWTPNYCLGALQYVGGDPLNPLSWKKHATPILRSSSDGKGPYGPGHACFVPIATGLSGVEEVWCVFHATDDEKGGWEGRRARCMKVQMGGGVGVGGLDGGVKGCDGVPVVGMGVCGGDDYGEGKHGRRGSVKELVGEIRKVLMEFKH